MSADIFLYVGGLLTLFVSRLGKTRDGKIARLSPAFICLAIPLFMIVVLRGDVGTDTANYVEQFQLRLQGGELLYGTFEPGFEALANFLLFVVNDARVSVNLISAVNFVLTLSALRKWGGDTAFCAATVVPAFIFDFTMNGLRIGLAFPLVIFSVILLERKNMVGFFIGVIAAASIQITAIPLTVLLLVDKIGALVKPRIIVVTVIVGCAVAYLFGNYLLERILSKAEFYELLQKPEDSSGAAPLLFSMILFGFAACRWSSLNGFRVVTYNAAFTLLQALGYQLSQITYAGLRVQLLVLFAQMLYAQRNVFPVSRNRLINNGFIFLLFLMFSVWKLRSFLVEDAGGPSPFLPYRFFWT